MADTDTRTVALLEELVALQKIANEQQHQALERTERYYADALERTEQAIALQKAAVGRQRLFVRVWLGTIVFVLAAIVGLLLALSRWLH